MLEDTPANMIHSEKNQNIIMCQFTNCPSSRVSDLNISKYS